jgi:hypothetical protein
MAKPPAGGIPGLVQDMPAKIVSAVSDRTGTGPLRMHLRLQNLLVSRRE